MENKKTVTVAKANKEEARKAIWKNDVKAVYDKKAKAYTTKETIGVKLMISSNGLSAIVKGVYVQLSPNADGNVTFKAFTKNTAKFDENSANFVNDKARSAHDAACKYLRAQYSIEDKKYNTLVELARKGTPLMNKQERKALQERKTA